MSPPLQFKFLHGRLVKIHGGRPSRALPQRRQEPLCLPARASSLSPVNHPSIPYLNGLGWEIGQHLGSGIDKAAYLLLDGRGKPRTDVVLKAAKFQTHCDDNQQCKNEIAMYEWLESVDHPFKCYFAAVVAIVENITLNGEVQTCYLSARCEQIGAYGADSEIADMRELLTEWFGIYDLHRKNLGVTAAGQPVVVDFGLFAGFVEVKAQWDEARLALGENATPQEVLDSLEPCYPTARDDATTERPWCDYCDCTVSHEHCHCTCCNEERRGSKICYECNTSTTETSRLSAETWSHIRCHTCLSLARENRHASQCHPEGSTGWRMHDSCKCDECRNARGMFNLARGLSCHEACRDAWAYRQGCPCKWCERARSENARLYQNMRVSVHRLESAPSLPKLNIGSDSGATNEKR